MNTYQTVTPHTKDGVALRITRTTDYSYADLTCLKLPKDCHHCAVGWRCDHCRVAIQVKNEHHNGQRPADCPMKLWQEE